MAILQCTSFGDTHGQHIDLDAYERMMVSRAEKTDVWLFMGDIINGSELSSWEGSYSDTRLVEEHNWAVDFLARHIDRIKPSAQVVVLSGNHGKGRTQRVWGGNPYHPDVLSIICDGQKMLYRDTPNGGKAWQPVKLYDWPNLHYRYGLNSWVTRVGKNLIAGHFEQASPVMETTRNNIELKYVRPRWPEATIILQAHTHRQGLLKSGPFVYAEQGCMCHPSEYNDFRGRSKWSPVRKGYCTFEYDRSAGLVDPSSVQLVDLGYETGFNPLCYV